MKYTKPWPMHTECPVVGYQEFKNYLNAASYHNAAPGTGEAKEARASLLGAVGVAVEHKWPYWAMDRMFREVAPLVDWSSFMQAYIDMLTENV